MASGRIAGVEPSGIIRLETANGTLRLRLAGVLPFPGAAGHEVFQGALAGAAGRTADAVIAAPPDRDGAEGADLRLDDDTLAAVLVRGGAAFVGPRGDDACRAPLLAAEDKARRWHLGGWSETGWPWRADDPALATAVPGFAVVRGRVASVGNRSARSYLDFGQDWSRDLTVTVPAALRDRLGGEHGLSALVGKVVEVRGYLTADRGPRMDLEDIGALRIPEDGNLPDLRTPRADGPADIVEMDGTP